MSRSVDILVGEILMAIDLLRRYTRDMDFDAFRSNVEKQDSVVRRLEIIGEAVKGIPNEVRAAYPEVPWRDIAGARDVLVHECFRVDLAMAWNMVQRDLPLLERHVLHARCDPASGVLYALFGNTVDAAHAMHGAIAPLVEVA